LGKRMTLRINPALIAPGLVLLAWVVTVILAVVSLRSRGRRAVLLSALALVFSVLGITVYTIRVAHTVTKSWTLRDGKKEAETTGWHVSSRWFFAGSGLVALSSLVLASRNPAWSPGRMKEPSQPPEPID
jgi:hypothetical protein